MSACPLQAMCGQGRAGAINTGVCPLIIFEFPNPPPRTRNVLFVVTFSVFVARVAQAPSPVALTQLSVVASSFHFLTSGGACEPFRSPLRSKGELSYRRWLQL